MAEIKDVAQTNAQLQAELAALAQLKSASEEQSAAALAAVRDRASESTEQVRCLPLLVHLALGACLLVLYMHTHTLSLLHLLALAAARIHGGLIGRSVGCKASPGR